MDNPVAKFRVDPAVLAKIDHIAKISGFTRSDVIRAALKRALPGLKASVEMQLKNQSSASSGE